MSKRVLIVDDEKDFVDVLATRLSAKGYEIESAFNGKECLEKALSKRPDIIILDIAMPEMNGFDACRKLKIDEHSKNIPVIILTAKFQPNDIEFAQELGADAYVTKPVELGTLLEKVENLLGTPK